MSWAQWVFWIGMVIEGGILVWFAAYAFLYVVPWEQMRQRREALAKLRAEYPPLLQRARHVVQLAERPAVQVRAASIADTQCRMTEDATRLAKLCLSLLEAVGRDLNVWPVGVLPIVTDVGSTLGMVEKICQLRDGELPELEKRLVGAATEHVASVEALRLQVLARAVELAGQGLEVGYEIIVLQQMRIAMEAHQPTVVEQPEHIKRLADDWLATVGDVAESIELRHVVRQKTSEVRATFDERVERVRDLQAALRPFIMSPAAVTAAGGKAGERLVSLAFADAFIERASSELVAAETEVRQQSRDVGAHGVSGKRLQAALRSAALADGLLDEYESQLSLLLAALAAAKSGPKGVD